MVLCLLKKRKNGSVLVKEEKLNLKCVGLCFVFVVVVVVVVFADKRILPPEQHQENFFV